MNKETLEEAAEKLYQKGLQNDLGLSFHDGIKFATEWQAERMYSEKDMISFAHFYFQEEFNSTMQTSKSTDEILQEWFEQFKKK